jgi:hypothetical protein
VKGPSPLAAWLTFTLYIGAANFDATPNERARLRNVIPPMLEGLKAGTVTAKEILAKVEEIMPPEWTPSDPWKTQIVRLWDGGR